MLQQTPCNMPEAELAMPDATLTLLGERLAPWLGEQDARTPLARLPGQSAHDE
ncbi:MAG TPA: hypothetical protein VLC08_15295 [Chitinolyticbacter sp.]|nr:hypothetical protein [Chitinolyticbacter sp.]